VFSSKRILPFDFSQRQLEETQNMRNLLAVAAAIAVGGLLALTSANAEPAHQAGGPLRDGNFCWVSTDNVMGWGYWQACPSSPHASRHMKKM
jgi:hypothetical protein